MPALTVSRSIVGTTMGRTFSAVPYTYLKRGVYYFVTVTFCLQASLTLGANWNKQEVPAEMIIKQITAPNVTIFSSQTLLERLRENSVFSIHCRPISNKNLALMKPAKIDGWKGYNSYTKNGLDFSEALSSQIVQVLAEPDRESSKFSASYNKLLDFARADSFQLERKTMSASWAVSQSLQLLLPSWQTMLVLQDYYGTKNQYQSMNNEIQNWLIMLYERAASERKTKGNQYTILGRNSMFLGILVNDVELIKNGVSTYIAEIDSLRVDGSFPFEANRGNLANVYGNKNIANLMQIAEMGVAQGVDLYKYKNKRGVGIHDAIEFVLKSEADNSIIDRYAKKDVQTPDKFRPMSQYPALDTKAGYWIFYYKQRFPDSALTTRLIKATPNNHRKSSWHYGDTGGPITCLRSGV